MQTTYLFKGLELSPKAVERIVARVPASAYDTKTDPERFTFREAMAHLAEWEQINIDRLHQGVAEPGCTVQGFDEGQFAIDHNYAALDPVVQAKFFADKRVETIAYLRTLTDEDWAKVFYHSERGEQTVFEQAMTILGHDMYHLEQFTEFLP